MSEAQEPLTLARHCGRLEAERFDLDLREMERREREDRLTRLASGGDDTITVSSVSPRESSELFLRMQRDLEQLSAFQHAVVHSKAWKLIQAVRRPFGRAW